jgi:hypothetical protein
MFPEGKPPPVPGIEPSGTRGFDMNISAPKPPPVISLKAAKSLNI